jgi:hypothetical protein
VAPARELGPSNSRLLRSSAAMLLVCDRGPLRVLANTICAEMAYHPE